MEKPDININDFKKICRICLIKKEEMLSFSSNNIMNMLEECSSKQMGLDERLPPQICNSCHWDLKVAYKFKQQCALSLEILCRVLSDENHDSKKPVKMINNLSVKIESIDIDDKDQLFVKTTREEVSDEDNKIKSEDEGNHSETDLQKKESLSPTCSKGDYSASSLKDESDDDSDNRDNNDDDNKVQLDSDDSSDSENGKDGKNVLRRKSLGDILIKKYKIYDLTCNVCNKTLYSKSTLLRHMRTHDKNRKFKYYCDTCNKGFYEMENLKKHVMRHTGNAKYHCDRCQKKFYVLNALGIHYRMTHKTDPVPCQKCDLQFNHKLQLELHERQVHEQKEFVCDVCGKVFNLRCKLKDHQRVHSDERPYACTFCSSTFKQNDNLQTHIKMQHTDPDRREMCFICGVLLRPGRLPMHLQSHNEPKTFKCEICNKNYCTKYVLRQHIKDNHGKEKKKYYCDICNKGLGCRGTLLKHMTIMHTNIDRKCSCHICGKIYRTRAGVRAHILSAHLDHRPHVCATCKKGFHTSTQLKNHMRTHTGERPFSCTVCGKAFGFREVLRTHMKIHNK